MAEREQTSDGFDEFERQLSALTVRPLTLDREALLFQAGKEVLQADRRRWRNRLRYWQAVAATLMVLTLGLSWHAWQGQPQIVERVHYERVPSVVVVDMPDDALFARKSPRRNRNHYLHQRYVALTVGLDGLDGLDREEGSVTSDPFKRFDNRTYRDLMDQFQEFQ